MKAKTVLAAVMAAVAVFASATFAFAPGIDVTENLFATAYAESEKKDIKNKEALHCLALNIYFEARGSNLADRVAVADVVLNRKKDRRYPDTVCGVVQQAQLDSNGQPRMHRCQFSWYCDGKPDNPKDKDRWEEAKLLAYQILVNGKYRGITEGATHYHATYVNPKWAASFQQVGRIGEHIFYRWE